MAAAALLLALWLVALQGDTQDGAHGGTVETDCEACSTLHGFHPYRCPHTVDMLVEGVKRERRKLLEPEADSIGEEGGDWAEQLARHWAHQLPVETTESQTYVVVGGGPVGLMNALGLLQAGVAPSSLTVVELRTDYTRDTWFDLDASFQSALEQWGSGLEAAALGMVRHAGSSSATVRSQVLERFLSRAVAATGVSMLYGCQYVATCGKQVRYADVRLGLWVPPAAVSAYACAGGMIIEHGSQEWPLLVLEGADWVIGADGSHSAVRRAAGVAFDAVDELRWADYAFLRSDDDADLPLVSPVPGLAQVTLIARLLPDEAGGCPAVRDSLPWEASYEADLERRVTHVFKRLFGGYCEVQILMTDRAGRRALAEGLAGDYAWQLLRSVAQFVLKADVPNRPALERLLLPKANGEPWVHLFPIAIRSVERPLQVAEAAAKAHLLLVGDASITANYRLGIGLNAAFAAMQALPAIVLCDGQQLCLASVAEEVAVAKQRNAAYQAGAVFFEAYCDLLLLQEPIAKADFLSRMVLYEKVGRTYSDLPVADLEEVLDICPLQ